MPIKADVNLNDDASSFSGSLLNINNPNINASTTNLAASAVAHTAAGNSSLKSQSEKFTRFDGGEQQIIVS